MSDVIGAMGEDRERASLNSSNLKYGTKSG